MNLNFALRFLKMIQVTDLWPMHILYIYVTHFYLVCAVDTRNCYIGNTQISNCATTAAIFPIGQYGCTVSFVFARIAWKK